MSRCKDAHRDVEMYTKLCLEWVFSVWVFIVQGGLGACGS